MLDLETMQFEAGPVLQQYRPNCATTTLGANRIVIGGSRSTLKPDPIAQADILGI